MAPAFGRPELDMMRAGTDASLEKEKEEVELRENAPHQLAQAEQDVLVIEEGKEKMSWAVQGLTLVAAISGFCFGYDTGVISPALVNIGTDLGHPLSDGEKEWISSGTSCGALVGALAGGTIADLIGRKWMLAVADVVLVVGGIVICTSYSVVQMICGRVILGAGVGISSAVAPVYIAELAPTRFRGMLLTVNALAITGAQFLSYIIALSDLSWRGLFALGVAPAVLQALSVHFLPESPRYDLNKGNVDAARRTLRTVYQGVSEGYIDLKVAAIQEAVDVSQAFQAKYSPRKRLAMLFTEKTLRYRTMIVAGIGLFQQLNGFNTLMYYSATIFTAAGIKDPKATGLVVSGSNFAFTIVSFFVLDRVGKRLILLICVPGQIIGLSLAAAAFAKMTAPTGGKLTEGYPYASEWTNMMIGMMVVFIASYATGLGNMTWHLNELFPLETRGMGATILAGFVWAGNIVISATFLDILDGIGAAGAFGLYAGICCVGLVFVICCFPETTGLSLEEAQTLFDDGFGVRKSLRLRREHKRLRRAEGQGLKA